MFVTFLNANDGAVEATTSFGLKMTFRTAEELAKATKELGLNFSQCYSSSSMDFASEYGFGSDGDAWNLVEVALETA